MSVVVIRFQVCIFDILNTAALRKLRYEGFPKYNVRLIMIFPLFHPKLRYAPYEDLIPITTLYSPFLVFPSA